jgi:Fe-S cluster assembly protein SufD
MRKAENFEKQTPAWLGNHFLQFENVLNGQKKAAVHGLRKAAYENFLTLGLPQTREESWKYTNVLRIKDLPLELRTEVPNVNNIELPKLYNTLATKAYRLVLVDGILQSDLSELPKNLNAFSLKEVLDNTSHQSYQIANQYFGQISKYQDDSFISLNTAFARHGLFLHLKTGEVLDRPIYVLCLTAENVTSPVTYPRVLLIAESGSKAEVIQHFYSKSEKQYLTNSVVEIFAKDNSTVSHITLQEEGSKAVHVSAIDVLQDNSSKVKTVSLSFGGKLVRNEVRPILNGEQIFTEMFGLSILDNDQHVDNTTLLDHAKPNCESLELYKGVYADKSKGVFSGTIIVREGAQKTNAIQSNQGLLLSNTAASYARPQLKIWADDVKCTHGATVGQLDEDALFYLLARGIPKSQAKAILVRAFLQEVIEKLDQDDLLAYVEELTFAKLKL